MLVLYFISSVLVFHLHLIQWYDTLCYPVIFHTPAAELQLYVMFVNHVYKSHAHMYLKCEHQKSRYIVEDIVFSFIF